jgi:hypothetical protein
MLKLLFILLLATPVEPMNVEPTELIVETTVGEGEVVAIADILNIEFQEDALLFVTSFGSFEIPTNSVNKIVFGERSTEDPTDIADVTIHDVQISIVDDEVQIESEYSIKTIYLVDVSGKLLSVQHVSFANEARVSLPGVGVYVLFLETSQGYVAVKIRN